MGSTSSFQQILEEKLSLLQTKKAITNAVEPLFFNPLERQGWAKAYTYLNPMDVSKYSVARDSRADEQTRGPQEEHFSNEEIETQMHKKASPPREEFELSILSLLNHELLALEQIINWDSSPAIQHEKVSLFSLKKSYRKLAKRFHPDRKGGDSERFSQLHECYECVKTGLERILNEK